MQLAGVLLDTRSVGFVTAHYAIGLLGQQILGFYGYNCLIKRIPVN